MVVAANSVAHFHWPPSSAAARLSLPIAAPAAVAALAPLPLDSCAILHPLSDDVPSPRGLSPHSVTLIMILLIKRKLGIKSKFEVKINFLKTCLLISSHGQLLEFAAQTAGSTLLQALQLRFWATGSRRILGRLVPANSRFVLPVGLNTAAKAFLVV